MVLIVLLTCIPGPVFRFIPFLFPLGFLLVLLEMLLERHHSLPGSLEGVPVTGNRLSLHTQKKQRNVPQENNEKEEECG